MTKIPMDAGTAICTNNLPIFSVPNSLDLLIFTGGSTEV